jgi:hypothetical protein
LVTVTVERRVVPQDGLVQLGDGGSRVDAEVLGQALGEAEVCVECLGLAAGPVQREHQLAGKGLTQRVLPGYGQQLAGDLPVTPESKLKVDAVFQGGHPLLV